MKQWFEGETHKQSRRMLKIKNRVLVSWHISKLHLRIHVDRDRDRDRDYQMS